MLLPLKFCTVYFWIDLCTVACKQRSLYVAVKGPEWIQGGEPYLKLLAANESIYMYLSKMEPNQFISILLRYALKLIFLYLHMLSTSVTNNYCDVTVL